MRKGRVSSANLIQASTTSRQISQTAAIFQYPNTQSASRKINHYKRHLHDIKTHYFCWYKSTVSYFTSKHFTNEDILQCLKLLQQNTLPTQNVPIFTFWRENQVIKSTSEDDLSWGKANPYTLWSGKDKDLESRDFREAPAHRRQQRSTRAPAPTALAAGTELAEKVPLLFSEVVPLEKLLHRSFVSLTAEDRAECRTCSQRSVFARIIQLFSTLLNLPKVVMLMKSKWNLCSILHLLVHATEISPTEWTRKTKPEWLLCIYKKLLYFIIDKLNASWVKKNMKKQSISS